MTDDKSTNKYFRKLCQLLNKSIEKEVPKLCLSQELEKTINSAQNANIVDVICAQYEHKNKETECNKVKR